MLLGVPTAIHSYSTFGSWKLSSMVASVIDSVAEIIHGMLHLVTMAAYIHLTTVELV